MFNVTLTPYTVADFAGAIKRSEIKVNHDYQRSAKVWPPAARSFLIETMLLGYPIPKLSLYQITDVKSRTTVKEIVDGQQRTHTIMEFYEDRLRLGRDALPTEAAGRTYSELDEEQQHKFLNYALSVDLFIGATKEDIREVFRRINSYTVPLNAEEKRHSLFQGPFKWFIYRLGKKYAQALESVGALTEKQLNRMQDAKLLSEIAHAMVKGILTTRDRELTRLYEEFDRTFVNEVDMERRIAKGMDEMLEYVALHHGPLMKPYHLYSLLLALMHSQGAIDVLDKDYRFTKKRAKEGGRALENLARLAAALDDPQSEPQLKEFVDAGAEKTNVGKQRQTRFVWFCRALADELP